MQFLSFPSMQVRREKQPARHLQGELTRGLHLQAEATLSKNSFVNYRSAVKNVSPPTVSLVGLIFDF